MLGEFVKIKHARSNIVVSLLKEVELMFRKLLIDSSLGAVRPLNPPYKSNNLPLSKISDLCAKIVINDSSSIEEIRNKTLFDNILEVTNEVVRFLRMARLQFENVQLKNIEEERKNEDNEMNEERSYFSFQDTTSDEGAEDENSDNDEI